MRKQVSKVLRKQSKGSRERYQALKKYQNRIPRNKRSLRMLREGL